MNVLCRIGLHGDTSIVVTPMEAPPELIAAFDADLPTFIIGAEVCGRCGEPLRIGHGEPGHSFALRRPRQAAQDLQLAVGRALYEDPTPSSSSDQTPPS